MAIVKTLNSYDFERAFIDAGRGDNFSYECKKILFDFLEELSNDIGEPIELDVIALCCEYCEMSLSELIIHYPDLGFSPDDLVEGEIGLDEITEELNNRTLVCGSYYCEVYEEDFIVFQIF